MRVNHVRGPSLRPMGLQVALAGIWARAPALLSELNREIPASVQQLLLAKASRAVAAAAGSAELSHLRQSARELVSSLRDSICLLFRQSGTAVPGYHISPPTGLYLHKATFHLLPRKSVSRTP